MIFSGLIFFSFKYYKIREYYLQHSIYFVDEYLNERHVKSDFSFIQIILPVGLKNNIITLRKKIVTFLNLKVED